MGIAGKTMKGRILTVLALLVASCQMKSTKHFLVETKTQTKDDEPARKGDDYFFSGSGGMGNIKIGGSHGDQGFGGFPRSRGWIFWVWWNGKLKNRWFPW